jgi:hypothetical protein
VASQTSLQALGTRLGVSQTFQPALKNAKDRLYARLAAITAHQVHRIDRRSEQIAQLAGRYDDISHIFKELLSGTKLEATKKRTFQLQGPTLSRLASMGRACDVNIAKGTHIAFKTLHGAGTGGAWRNAMTHGKR